MAANIQTFASLRKPAWHGLGTILETPVSALEFQNVAGLNWNVYDAPIFSPSRVDEVDGKTVRIPGVQYEGQKFIMRDDNHTPLGIVGSDYESIQNSELFGFIKDLGEFDLDLTVETAGALGNGETVWAMARVESLRMKLGDDCIDPYLLICNGHIGNRKLIVLPTTIRVVCQNTLRMAIQASKKGAGLSEGWAIRHTTNAHERLAQAQKSIQESIVEWNTTKEAIARLADVKASDDFITDLINATFGESKSDSKRGETLTENRNKKIFEILSSSTCTVSGTEGTIWSAFNAVTEYLDHESIQRVENKQEGRFSSNLIDGPSVKYKAKAWDYSYSVATA